MLAYVLRSAASKKFIDAPMPLQSIRTITPLLGIGFLIIFGAGNLVLSHYIQFITITTLSGHAVVFAFTWLAINAISVHLSNVLSKRIQSLREKIDSTGALEGALTSEDGLVELVPVVDSLNQMRKKHSESAEENQRARSAAALLQRNAQIAHDIRSPLSVIAGCWN